MDGLEGHVTRAIFTMEAMFEPYDCANLNLTVTFKDDSCSVSKGQAETWLVITSQVFLFLCINKANIYFHY